jgi:hypothetical protein
MVVWEGRSREAPPYPDLWPEPEATVAAGGVRCLGSTCRRSVGPDPPLVTHRHTELPHSSTLVRGRAKDERPVVIPQTCY